jgi:hypothetical protein
MRREGYTVYLSLTLNLEGSEQELSVGLSGSTDGQRAFDLVWDEPWVGKYFDPDMFYEKFVAMVHATQIDMAYENSRGV